MASSAIWAEGGSARNCANSHATNLGPNCVLPLFWATARRRCIRRSPGRRGRIRVPGNGQRCAARCHRCAAGHPVAAVSKGLGNSLWGCSGSAARSAAQAHSHASGGVIVSCGRSCAATACAWPRASCAPCGRVEPGRVFGSDVLIYEFRVHDSIAVGRE